MEKHLFTIGEVARMKGITIKALRFYDKIGLLHPHHVDPQTQYRYYHIDQFVLLDIIKAARSMDISPMDLVTLFQKKDTSGLMAHIQAHRDELARKIAQMKMAIEGMDRVADTIETAQRDQFEKQVFQKPLPERVTLTVPYHPNQKLEDYILDYSVLAGKVHAAGITHTYESGVLLELEQSTLLPTALWTGVIEKTASGTCLCIPGGSYLCVVCTQDNAEEKVALLSDALAALHVEPSFLLQVELLTDVFLQSNFIEMQAPLFQGVPTLKQFPSLLGERETSHS